MVARGGLRWSDRREDFRTEILGLVKAQQVKNSVIVPVGSKGGFVVKRPPDGGDREALIGEGIECYRTFVRGLLDITDNRKGNKVAAPENVVRLDDDDPYLVVAADKGTAAFPTSPTRFRRLTASGSAMPSPRAAALDMTTKKWPSPPAAPGNR